MGIFDSLKSAATQELVEIIEWKDDTRSTLAWRFPDEDGAIKRGAQLVVRESQAAQFVYLGQFADLFGPGLHTLDTENIPVLTTLKGWKYGFETPFKADVYYVTTRVFSGQKWGTSNPILLRDADFGLVRARAYGTYDMRIVDPAQFLRAVVGTSPSLTLSQFDDTMRPRLVGVFSECLATARLPIVDVAMRYREVSKVVAPAMNEVCIKDYGLSIQSFVIEHITVPPEVEQAIDKRASIAALGDLDAYMKKQVADSLTLPGAGSGMVRTGIDLALGAELGQQLASTLRKKAK